MLKITKMLTVVVAVLGLVSVSNAAITAESWVSGVQQGDDWYAFEPTSAYTGSGNWNWGGDLYIARTEVTTNLEGYLTIDDGYEATGSYMRIGPGSGGSGSSNHAYVTVTGKGSLLDVTEGLSYPDKVSRQ